MPNAFSNVTMINIQSNLRGLFYRRQKIGKLAFTFEEYIDTFVAYEARDTFRQAAQWARPDRRQHKWDLRLMDDSTVNATLMLVETNRHGEYAPPVPRFIGIQGDAPPAIVERIHEWAMHGGDPSREFGRVLYILNILNQNFSRVAIRYYWPTILAICSEGHHTKDLVQEMQDLKMPARLKPLPPGLAAACRLTAETIATARLIPSDVEEPNVEGKAVLEIAVGQHYNEAVGTFWGMT